jgi:hypothetical protein
MTLTEYLNREAELKLKLQMIDDISRKYNKADTESILIHEGLSVLFKETEKELKKIERIFGA